MARPTARTALDAGALALTVHGPAGVVDLVVPATARAGDVAREYAAQCRLAAPPRLRTRRGDPVPPGDAFAAHGVVGGDVLAVEGPIAVPLPRRAERPAPAPPGVASRLWVGAACGSAVLAGWLAAHGDGARRDATVVLLAVGALTGLLPVGRFAPRRAIVAPAFAGAAAFVEVCGPEADRIPAAVGVAALVAAVVAAAARATDRRAETELWVWVVAGAGVFVVTTACGLVGTSPQVPWAILLLASVLAARLVPTYAVDVPDHFLIGLEQVTAWSARPRGRQGCSPVSPDAVAEVAGRGARLLTASAWAILVVAGLSAPMLLVTATAPIDRVGARVVVLAGGCALLLAARSYRHAGPRGLLRLAGALVCLAGIVAVLRTSGDGAVVVIGLAAVVLGGVVVVAAVATGRGRRSVWWASRADLAEALAGAVALGTLVVATGLFRRLWESGFGV